IDVYFAQVEPILAVPAQAEEHLLAVEGWLRFEYRAGRQKGELAKFAINQSKQVLAGSYRAHRAFAAVIGRTARVDVAVAPVVAPLVNALATVGFLVEHRRADEDDVERCGWSGGRTVLCLGSAGKQRQNSEQHRRSETETQRLAVRHDRSPWR